MVLVHGTMDRSTSFGRVARLLDDRTIVRLDRRGYGRSQDLGPPTRFEDQVDDLAGVLDTVAADGPAVVFGHSYGGVVALATASQRSTCIGAVVAYESPMAWRSWWPTTSAGASAIQAAEDPAGAAERFMSAVIGPDRWARLPPSTKDARRAEGPTLVAEMRQARPPSPIPYDPRDVAVPVVAAHGTAAVAHHRRAVETLAEEAPQGELVVVEGAGHGVHLSHPRAVVDLLERARRRLAD